MSGSNPFFEIDNNPFGEEAGSSAQDSGSSQQDFITSDVFGDSFSGQPDASAGTGGAQDFEEYNESRDMQFQPAEFRSVLPGDTNSFDNSSGFGGSSDGFYGGPNVDAFDNEPVYEESASKSERKWHQFYKISFYQPFFNVTTMDVLYRMYSGLNPFGKNFFDRISPNPDLYGPFWVATTVLFMLAAISNLASYFEYWRAGRKDDWNYDFIKITFAAGAVYGYLLVVSLVFWAVQKFLKVGLSLIECFSVYGYSFTVYMAATVICLLPFNWLQWILIGIACVVSTFMLVWSLLPPLRKIEWKKSLPILCVVGLLHVALAFTFKLYFFQFNVETPSESSEPPASNDSVASSQGQ